MLPTTQTDSPHIWGLQFSEEHLQEYLSYFGTNPYVQAAVVLVVFLLAAKLLDIFITRGVSQLTRRSPLKIDDEIIRILHQPVFGTVVLIGVGVALNILQPPEGLLWVSVSAIKTLIILLWLIFAVQLGTLSCTMMSLHPTRFRMVQPATLPLFEIATKVIVVGGAVYFVFVAWGIDLTAWAASAGIVGIAVGFAARDTLANLFAGVFILADAPYKIGDFIVLESGERGQVSMIGLRSTRILTRDDIEITIPNSTIANSKVVNENGGPSVRSRIRIKVGVAYGSDLEAVEQVLIKAAADCEFVIPDPTPRVRFRQFGDSSLDFELLCWIDQPVLRGRTIHQLLKLVYRGLAEADITIPFPQRDLYLKEIPERGRGEKGSDESDTG